MRIEIALCYYLVLRLLVYKKMTKKIDYRAGVEHIKSLLNLGAVTYDDAKVSLKPILNGLNKEASKIAKKYGKKHTPFTTAGLLR